MRFVLKLFSHRNRDEVDTSMIISEQTVRYDFVSIELHDEQIESLLLNDIVQ
jgi:hypothetical protein